MSPLHPSTQETLVFIADGLKGIGATLVGDDLSNYQVCTLGAAVKALGVLASKLATDLEMMEADE